MKQLLILLCLIGVPNLAQAAELTVFAGSASQPPLEELADSYRQRTGVEVTIHFGGSGAMLNQIQLTGRGDIYIPGSPDFMLKAQQLGLVDPEEHLLAYLLPAIVVPKGNPAGIQTLSDLARPGLRVGLADPEGVCVGLYAIELLVHNQLLEPVSKNLVGMVESCAKVAALIPLRQVDAVLGWREFASWSPRTSEVIALSPEQIPRIAYIPAALVKAGKQQDLARGFLDFLTGPEGNRVFEEWGYITSEATIRQFAPAARKGGEYQLPEGWQ